MLTIRHLSDGSARAVERRELADVIDGPGLVWIDLDEPTEEEQQVVSSPALHLHQLIIEDMFEDRHLPKLDAYPDQVLMTVHAIAIERSGLEVGTTELDIVVRGNVVVTHHVEPITSVRLVGEHIDDLGALGFERPGQLVHHLLDVMGDVFAPFVAQMEQRLEIIEEDILSRPTQTTRREIFALQRDLVELRRVVLPQAEVIRRLGRDGSTVFSDDDTVLFRDIFDHVFRMGELIESYGQLAMHAHDQYRAAVDDDLNRMLKVLTMFSALLLPISVVAGIYGMNFVHMPELDETWAYPLVWGVFLSIVVGGLVTFRLQGWIGSRAEEEVQARRSRLGRTLDIPVLGQVLKVPQYGARAVLHTGRTVFRLPLWVARRLARRSEPDEPER